MNDPVVMDIERTGYPSWMEERECVGLDELGNELYEGDEVLEIDDKRFLVETLTCESIEILEALGAERDIL